MTIHFYNRVDKLLSHLESFSANPAFYTLPEGIAKGVPLFHMTEESSVPELYQSEVGNLEFVTFWRPVRFIKI